MAHLKINNVQLTPYLIGFVFSSFVMLKLTRDLLV